MYIVNEFNVNLQNVFISFDGNVGLFNSQESTGISSLKSMNFFFSSVLYTSF